MYWSRRSVEKSRRTVTGWNPSSAATRAGLVRAIPVLWFASMRSQTNTAKREAFSRPLRTCSASPLRRATKGLRRRRVEVIAVIGRRSRLGTDCERRWSYPARGRRRASARHSAIARRLPVVGNAQQLFINTRQPRPPVRAEAGLRRGGWRLLATGWRLGFELAFPGFELAFPGFELAFPAFWGPMADFPEVVRASSRSMILPSPGEKAHVSWVSAAPAETPTKCQPRGWRLRGG